MASQSGRKRTSIIEKLFEEPYRFSFFQAVRLMEAAAQTETGEQGPRRRIGEDNPPMEEVVHFHAHVSHSFPTGEISSLKKSDDGSPDDMTVSFMGMFGPTGVLPQHYTQTVIDRTRKKDTALRDFLDVFNHRVVSLFYRAWEKYRFPIAYERAEHNPDAKKRDLFTEALFCLIGQGTGHIRGRQRLPDDAFLYYSGHFAHRPATASSLRNIISDCFELPTEIQQFHGQWLFLDPETDQSRLSSFEMPQGMNAQLGVSVVVGERVWSVENKFRIRLGPLNFEQFQQLSPTGVQLEEMCQLVRTYVGMEFDFDVQPILLASDVPMCQLGADDTNPPRLGWNTWLCSQPFPNDADDAVFTLEGLPSL